MNKYLSLATVKPDGNYSIKFGFCVDIEKDYAEKHLNDFSAFKDAVENQMDIEFENLKETLLIEMCRIRSWRGRDEKRLGLLS